MRKPAVIAVYRRIEIRILSNVAEAERLKCIRQAIANHAGPQGCETIARRT